MHCETPVIKHLRKPSEPNQQIMVEFPRSQAKLLALPSLRAVSKSIDSTLGFFSQFGGSCYIISISTAHISYGFSPGLFWKITTGR
jgi:hypothetical protein